MKSNKDNQYYLSQKINISKFGNTDIANIERNIESIKKISHPNIMKCKESFKEAN